MIAAHPGGGGSLLEPGQWETDTSPRVAANSWSHFQGLFGDVRLVRAREAGLPSH